MKRRGAIPAIAIALSLLTAAGAQAAIDKEPVVAHSFNGPVYVAHPRGDSRRLFVVVQPGLIRLIKDGALLETPFLDIRDRVEVLEFGQERGLLSVAFPPNYGNGAGSTTRRFYVFFTNNDGDIRITELKRKRSTGDRASTGYSRTVLKIPHPNPNHNGGQLQFGPDGYLYASIGDGGVGGDEENDAQNTEVLLGKLLRIDPLPSGASPYAIPPDNPFAGETPGRNEIYSLGFRNPWRFSFDGDDLAIGDVGEGSWEEIDFIDRQAASGANFGWSGYEGFEVFDEERADAISVHTEPVLVYPNPGGAGNPLAAVVGGYVVHDPALTGLTGRYLYTDAFSGELRSFDPANPSGTDAAAGVSVFWPSSFGVDDANHVYVASRGDGRVYRLINTP